MAETVRTADYFYVMVPDRPGEGARVLGELRSAGVNLVAYSGFPSGRGTPELAEDPGALPRLVRHHHVEVLRGSHGLSHGVLQTGSSMLRNHSEAEPADQLARGGHDVDRPPALRRGWKRGLARVRSLAL